ncbi:MAG: hypothetical protein ABIP06_05975 [Pyrinomonadaceae bacterium]
MISQRCPKCGSSRIRAGYRPTPIWLKLLFRFNLLCNNCNWEFKGFAVPGTVSSKPKRNKKKSSESNAMSDNGDSAAAIKSDDAEIIEETKTPITETEKIRKKRKIKIRL